MIIKASKSLLVGGWVGMNSNMYSVCSCSFMKPREARQVRDRKRLL